MIYRPFGKTGKELSSIGFGGMRFGEIDNPAACAEMLLEAYNSGINYFDTAPGYFGGKSEERFGLALKQMQTTRSEKPYYISTKSNKADPDDIRRDLEESLQRMGIDHVDFFHMWWVVRPEWYYERKAKGALKMFERLQDEGLISHIMLSSHMSGPAIEEVLQDYPFEGVLLGYSAMNFAYRDRALTAAAENNRGVVVMNPLGGGLIPQHAERLDFMRTRDDESIVEAALRFLINDQRINVSLVGFSNKAEVREAVNAVNGFKPIPADKIEQIRGNVCNEFNDMCTGCGYCLPCPQKIPIPGLMQSYNEKLFGNPGKSVTGKLKWGFGILEDNRIDACSECGLCEERCTQQIPVRERLKKLKKVIADNPL